MALRRKGYSWLIKNIIDKKYRSGLIIVGCQQGQHAAGTKTVETACCVVSYLQRSPPPHKKSKSINNSMDKFKLIKGQGHCNNIGY